MLLREDGGLWPAQIAAELGKGRPAVRQLLKRMREDNQITKQGTKYVPTLTMSHKVTEREKKRIYRAPCDTRDIGTRVTPVTPCDGCDGKG